MTHVSLGTILRCKNLASDAKKKFQVVLDLASIAMKMQMELSNLARKPQIFKTKLKEKFQSSILRVAQDHMIILKNSVMTQKHKSSVSDLK